MQKLTLIVFFFTLTNSSVAAMQYTTESLAWITNHTKLNEFGFSVQSSQPNYMAMLKNTCDSLSTSSLWRPESMPYVSEQEFQFSGNTTITSVFEPTNFIVNQQIAQAKVELDKFLMTVDRIVHENPFMPKRNSWKEFIKAEFRKKGLNTNVVEQAFMESEKNYTNSYGFIDWNYNTNEEMEFKKKFGANEINYGGADDLFDSKDINASDYQKLNSLLYPNASCEEKLAEVDTMIADSEVANKKEQEDFELDTRMMSSGATAVGALVVATATLVYDAVSDQKNNEAEERRHQEAMDNAQEIAEQAREQEERHHRERIERENNPPQIGVPEPEWTNDSQEFDARTEAGRADEIRAREQEENAGREDLKNNEMMDTNNRSIERSEMQFEDGMDDFQSEDNLLAQLEAERADLLKECGREEKTNAPIAPDVNLFEPTNNSESVACFSDISGAITLVNQELERLSWGDHRDPMQKIYDYEIDSQREINYQNQLQNYLHQQCAIGYMNVCAEYEKITNPRFNFMCYTGFCN